MIKDLIGSNGVIVLAGTSSYPYVNMSNASAGMIRYNGSNQNLEVYDGSSWVTLPGNHTRIELDMETRRLLEWVKAKCAEEEYLKKQAESNPTIKDLLNQRNDIDHKITMVRTLLKNECSVCNLDEVID
jgi:hypothetical protein